MKVTIITPENVIDIYNKQFAKDEYFHPVVDRNGNIIISEIEVQKANKKEFPFLADVELKEHSEILKEFQSEKEKLEYYKTRKEKELQDITIKLEAEDTKGKIKK